MKLSQGFRKQSRTKYIERIKKIKTKTDDELNLREINLKKNN